MERDSPVISNAFSVKLVIVEVFNLRLHASSINVTTLPVTSLDSVSAIPSGRLSDETAPIGRLDHLLESSALLFDENQLRLHASKT